MHQIIARNELGNEDVYLFDLEHKLEEMVKIEGAATAWRISHVNQNFEVRFVIIINSSNFLS